MSDQSMTASALAYLKERRTMLNELIEKREQQIKEFQGDISDYRTQLLELGRHIAALEQEAAEPK